MEESRYGPAATQGGQSGDVEYTRLAGAPAVRCLCALRREGPLAWGPQRRQWGEMESGERLCRSDGENRLHLYARGFWGLPTARGICGACPAKRRKPGARKQRRFFDGAVRNSGPRFLRK